MSKPKRAISDLQARELVSELGLSKSYASELLKRLKTPSLDLAVRIEERFNVPAACWVQPQDRAA